MKKEVKKNRKIRTKAKSYLDNDYCDERLDEIEKPFVQFSKRMVAFLIANLLVIELFVMFMIYRTNDTSTMPYLITGIATTIVTGFIWYFKNSEAEKRARIDAEVERMKLQGKVPVEAFDKLLSSINDEIEDEPDTYYKDDGDNTCATDIVEPIESFTPQQEPDEEAVG